MVNKTPLLPSRRRPRDFEDPVAKSRHSAYRYAHSRRNRRHSAYATFLLPLLARLLGVRREPWTTPRRSRRLRQRAASRPGGQARPYRNNGINGANISAPIIGIDAYRAYAMSSARPDRTGANHQIGALK